MPVILCHKCSGVLAHTPEDKEHGLNHCQCISGWVRGFEPHLTVEQAAQSQVKRELERKELYASQGRPEFFSPERMERALKKCPK